METNKEQQHTPEPWNDGLTHPVSSIGNCVVRSLSDIDFQRAQKCVNAMEGIENPEAFVKDAIKAFRQPAIELDLQKYKTACESINKDNPLAVAENLHRIVNLLKTISSGLLFPNKEQIKNKAKELLTKIQEGK